jgi:hypothetical protein
MDDLFIDFGDVLAVDPADEFETTRQLPQAITHERREAQRRFVNGLKKQALRVLVPTLPPPDTDLHIVANGAGAERRWKPGGIDQETPDFGTFALYLAELLGPGSLAYISTWTMNRNHCLSLVEMLDTGAIARLVMFTDPYFRRREAAVAAELVTGIARHPGSRFLAFKNHAKVIALVSADGQQTVTVTGSANLSAQPRTENYVLTTAPDVFEFYRDQFFEAMLNHA